MALFKEILQKNGVITSYHRISRIVLIPQGNAEVSVSSYLDQETRRTKQPVTIKTYIFPYNSWGYGYENNWGIGAFYELLKLMEEYSSATDILEEKTIPLT